MKATFVRHEQKPEGLYLTGATDLKDPNVELFVPATMVGIIGMLSQQTTLADALNLSERAICATQLFVIIVQDRAELGGGYGIQVIALDDFYSMQFGTLDEVEAFLAENTPSTIHASTWTPLPCSHSHQRESEYLDKIEKFFLSTIERTTR